MRDRSTVETRVREMLAKRLRVSDPTQLPSDIPLFHGGLGLDSMSAVDLLQEIEREFAVYIDDDNFEVLDSIDQLVAFLARASRP
jgi:acyl carrier protein